MACHSSHVRYWLAHRTWHSWTRPLSDRSFHVNEDRAHVTQRREWAGVQSTSTQYDSAHDTKHEGYITSSYTKETERECTDHLRWAREKNTSWPRTEQSTRVCRGSWKPKLFGTSPQSTPNAKYTCLVRISRWIHFCSKSLNKVVNHSTNWLNN